MPWRLSHRWSSPCSRASWGPEAMRPRSRPVRSAPRRTSADPTVGSLHDTTPTARNGSVSAHRREMFAPPAVSSRRRRRIGRLLRFTRSRALVAAGMGLAVSLVVLLGGTLASAAFAPDSGTPVAPAAATQPAPPTDQPQIPIPSVDPDPCGLFLLVTAGKLRDIWGHGAGQHGVPTWSDQCRVGRLARYIAHEPSQRGSSMPSSLSANGANGWPGRLALSPALNVHWPGRHPCCPGQGREPIHTGCAGHTSCLSGPTSK